MATGRLAGSDLAAGANTTVYTTPADTYTVASVNIVNRGTQPTVLNLAIADLDTPTLGEYIEWETELLPKNILGREMYRKLFVYKGSEHPHAAQRPKKYKLKG